MTSNVCEVVVMVTTDQKAGFFPEAKTKAKDLTPEAKAKAKDTISWPRGHVLEDSISG